jgi:hypothetical protein
MYLLAAVRTALHSLPICTVLLLTQQAGAAASVAQAVPVVAAVTAVTSLRGGPASLGRGTLIVCPTSVLENWESQVLHLVLLVLLLLLLTTAADYCCYQYCCC